MSRSDLQWIFFSYSLESKMVVNYRNKSLFLIYSIHRVTSYESVERFINFFNLSTTASRVFEKLEKCLILIQQISFLFCHLPFTLLFWYHATKEPSLSREQIYPFTFWTMYPTEMLIAIGNEWNITSKFLSFPSIERKEYLSGLHITILSFWWPFCPLWSL